MNERKLAEDVGLYVVGAHQDGVLPRFHKHFLLFLGCLTHGVIDVFFYRSYLPSAYLFVDVQKLWAFGVGVEAIFTNFFTKQDLQHLMEKVRRKQLILWLKRIVTIRIRLLVVIFFMNLWHKVLEVEGKEAHPYIVLELFLILEHFVDRGVLWIQVWELWMERCVAVVFILSSDKDSKVLENESKCVDVDHVLIRRTFSIFGAPCRYDFLTELDYLFQMSLPPQVVYLSWKDWATLTDI